MDLYAVLQYGIFLLIVTALVYPFGGYLTRVFAGESTWLDPGLRPMERLIYRLAGIDAHHEMDWKEYASAFVVFSAASALLLYAMLRVQPFLHTFDPVYQPLPLSPDLALNTAISFVTTTTWQGYGGETTRSYRSQIVGLAVQNFLAGAAGLAVGIAFIRGLARERTRGLGNFWVDLTRWYGGTGTAGSSIMSKTSHAPLHSGWLPTERSASYDYCRYFGYGSLQCLSLVSGAVALVLLGASAACEAALRGEGAPSLLPASDQKAQAAA